MVGGWADTVEAHMGFYFSKYTVILCYLPQPTPFLLRGAEAKERGMLDAAFPESVVNNAKGCADWSEQTLWSPQGKRSPAKGHSRLSCGRAGSDRSCPDLRGSQEGKA